MGNLRRDRGAGACGGLDPLGPSVGRRKGRRKLPLAGMAASTLGFGASGLVMPLSVSVTDTGDFAIFSALIVGIATLIIGWMSPLKEVSQTSSHSRDPRLAAHFIILLVHRFGGARAQATLAGRSDRSGRGDELEFWRLRSPGGSPHGTQASGETPIRHSDARRCKSVRVDWRSMSLRRDSTAAGLPGRRRASTTFESPEHAVHRLPTQRSCPR